MAGSKTHQDDIIRRLRRIEGQVRGLQRMVEEGVRGAPPARAKIRYWAFLVTT
ncbi:metal-sensing transcriptional repressor [Streptomyces sp. NPDC001020]